MLPDFQQQTYRYLTGRILDIGYVSKPLALTGDIVGVDIQQAPCPPNYREVRMANLNIEPIPYADASFESIFAGETIEHLANPMRFLAECNRVLVPHGVCVLTTPNPYYWIDIIQNAFPSRFPGAENDQHFNSPTRIAMRTCARRASFRVEREEGTFIHIPIIRKKVTLRRWPLLTSQTVYVLRKTDEFKHSIMVSRPHQRGDLPKEFELDARLF